MVIFYFGEFVFVRLVNLIYLCLDMYGCWILVGMIFYFWVFIIRFYDKKKKILFLKGLGLGLGLLDIGL